MEFKPIEDHDDRYIDEVFGSQGILAKHFDGYSPREGQIVMAKAVDKSLAEGRHLMVEGPTGTGKSLAYGVPAAWHATKSGQRVAIVTANIALQEQLFVKDLPFLAKVLPWSFRYALIKGRNNYLCIDRWQDEQKESSFKNRRNRRQLSEYRSILKWAGHTKEGDKSELDFEPNSGIWRLFSVTSDECKGKDCRHFEDCFAEKAKAKVADADVFVTNYHLLFADLKVRAATETASVLPDYSYVICDEGHKAADIAREFFGFRISEGSVRFASRLLGRLREEELYSDMESQASEFFYDLKKLYNSKGYKTRFKKPPESVRWTGLRDSLSKANKVFADEMETAPTSDEKASFRRAATAAARMSSNISAAMTLADDKSVYFLEESPNGSVILKGKPISVGEFLSTALFGHSSVVTTSATLAVSGGFSHVIEELGAPDPDSLIVSSPFNFKEQVLLIVPDNMPPPTNPAYPQAVAKAVSEIIKMADGKTLGLFTSYRNLGIAHEKALTTGYNVFRQGDMPRTMLVEKFRKDVKSVLLGTESFWAGVDVPGEALSCVIIDRLPFPTPDDPVLDAITGRDSNWFMNYSVPRAIIAFKQGFGRLVRSISDRGVVVVLDQRIATKSYGRLFLASLPDVPKSRKLENVGRFLYEMR